MGCVYVLVAKGSLKRYVGETSKNVIARLFEHMAEAFHAPKRKHGEKNSRKQEWLRELYRSGNLPDIEILEDGPECEDRKYRLQRESACIKELESRGFDVLNTHLSKVAFEVQNLPEVKAAQIAAQRIAQNRSDVAQKKSDSNRKTKSDPLWKAAQREKEKTPERKRKRRAAAALNHARRRLDLMRWEGEGGSCS